MRQDNDHHPILLIVSFVPFIVGQKKLRVVGGDEAQPLGLPDYIVKGNRGLKFNPTRPTMLSHN